jgi:capsular exopolysaccharide synthesis family protein
MNLKSYFDPLIKWWWLLLVASLIAAVSSFLVTRQQPPIYESSTALVIGRSVYALNPTPNDIWLEQQLANFYTDIALRDQVRNATKEALGLNWLPEYNVRPLPNSPIIEIVVRDTDPLRGQVVTTELANQLILQAPSSSEQQDQEHQEFVDEQLSNLEDDINETQDEIASLQEQLADMNSARQIAETQQEIGILDAKLTTLQSNYAALLTSSGQDADNTITVIEPAVLPTRPVGPNKGMIILLSTAIGFTLATGAAYLLNYLDDTFRSGEEITQTFQIPVIGQVFDIGRGKNEKIFVTENPRSDVTEGFRTLRTNLEFANVDKPLKTILVTSAGINDGKTFVSVNLANIMAQAGKSVILLDADLRKPSIHKDLGLSNSIGLSDMFRGSFNLRLDLNTAVSTMEDSDVKIVTGGSIPPNPAELLGSNKMDQILENFEQMADVIIIDGPPGLVADSSILSKKTDGVLIVVRHEHTRERQIRSLLEQFERADANILGVVFNQIPRSRVAGLGFYQYYNGYGDSDDSPKSESPFKDGGKFSLKKWLRRSDDESERIPIFDDMKE